MELEPTFVGDFEDEASAAFAVRIGRGIERGGGQAIQARNTANCDDAVCVHAATEQAGASHAMRVVVEKDERDYHITAQLLNADGELVSSVSQTCEICGLEEAAGMLEAAATKLASLAAQEALHAVLSVRTNPPGASLKVDDEGQQSAPAELSLSPGEHLLEASKPGYHPASRRVTVHAGVNTELEIALLPEQRASDTAKVLSWVGVGGGAVFLVGGLGLIAWDGRDYKSRCSDSNVDRDGDCRFVYRTKWVGGTLAVLGAGAAAIGATVLLLDYFHSKRVQPTISARGVGLQGRF